MMRENSINIKTKIAVQHAICVFLMLTILFYTYPSDAQSGGAPTIIRDTEIENILEEWSAPILRSSQIGENGIRMVLVQSNDINAFVAGGANIFVYTGLIQKTENPGELIAVLAHEMGHIAGGHLIKMQDALERASYESILGAVLGLGAAIASGNGAAASAIITGSQDVATRRLLKHSRVNESAADQAAYTYLTQAGLNPSGLSSFLSKLEDQELLPVTQQSEYMRTHPVTRDRVEAVDALLTRTDLTQKPMPAAWTEQHARMKAKLLGFINPEQVAWAYEDSDKSIAAQYARAIAAYRLDDIPTALRDIDALIAAEPDNAYFHELKGQMLVDFGRVKEGLPSYQTAVKILPDASLLRIALAHALLESGNSDPAAIEEAITHLDRAALVEKRSARIHRLLATAHGRLGHESTAKLHLAEEAMLQGRLPYAKSLAEAALTGFRAGSPEWLEAKDLLTHIANVESLKN